MTGLCPQTTTFLKKKDSRSGIEPRPLCFKPADKPSCRPPLVIPRDNSGKRAALWVSETILLYVHRNEYGIRNTEMLFNKAIAPFEVV